jgi:excinuclease ABC subunit A
LGLGYLSLNEARHAIARRVARLRLAYARSVRIYFGVVYVLDEPSAGIASGGLPSVAGALDRLKGFRKLAICVEHELDVIRQRIGLSDVGPAPEKHGGQILYSGSAEDWNPFENRERGPTCSERKSHAIALRERRVDGFGWRA